MKKLICIVLSLIMILPSAMAFADDPIGIYLNGQLLETDVPPIIVSDRTMVPFRAVLEAIGAEVTWNEANKMVSASLDDIDIILFIDSDTMYTNTSAGEIHLDAAPFINNGRTMIPIRAVCEIFGCEVDWHAPSRSVVIRMPGYYGPSLPESVTNPPAQDSESNNYQEIILDGGAYHEKDTKSLIETAITLINEHRTANGLETFAYSDELEVVAYNHCKDMADNDYIDYTSPDGTTLSQRLENNNIAYNRADECIASGITSPEKVVESWMNTPTNKAKILNENFTKVALGYYAGGPNGTYWTLDLIAD